MHFEAKSGYKFQVVKESFIDFLTTQVPNADLDAVDDIIVSYVFNAIDAVEVAPEEFFVHVNELVDIISAYVIDFSKIDRDLVYLWIEDVMAEAKQTPYMDQAGKADKKDVLNFNLPSDLPSTSSSGASSRSASTSEDEPRMPSSSVRKVPSLQMRDFETALEATQKQAVAIISDTETFQYNNILQFLTEMFPDTSPIEIKHCVTIALGDVDRALATLLHRRDHGQALSVGALPARTNKPATADNEQVKKRVIARYSYIDREMESKEHKPLAPRLQPAKLLRYRDNRIVSVRGERFTEVPKDEEEGGKKSNKKHHP